MMLRFALAALALAAPAAARAEWVEASTDHFVVYANDKPERVQAFATELEKFEKVMRLAYPNARKSAIGPANRVSVFVLPDTNGMEKLTGSDFIRGFYIARAGDNVAFVPRVSGRAEEWELSGTKVLRHEYAHHFMYTSFPGVFPLWFSEGFAEYWATVKFEKDGGALIGTPPAHRAWGLLDGNPLPVDQMLTLTDRKLTREQSEAVYGRGWLLTHYLMSDPARLKLLGAYVAALYRGEPAEKAAAVFGDLKALGKELDRYLRSPRFQGRRVPAAELATGPVKLRPLTPGEIATMAVRVESNAGVTEEEAQKIVLAARKAATPFPNDPGAQVALAEAEYDAGNFALAEAAAERAVAANRLYPDALVYRAMAKFARAEAEDKDGTMWPAVRRAVVDANRADPEDPRPLILFYKTYETMGQTPSDAAKAGLAKAYDTAQSDTGLRLKAAAMFLMDGNRAEAREALRMIAFHPHGGELADRARAMIAAIDQGVDPVKVLEADAKAEAEDKKDDKPAKD